MKSEISGFSALRNAFQAKHFPLPVQFLALVFKNQKSDVGKINEHYYCSFNPTNGFAFSGKYENEQDQVGKDHHSHIEVQIFLKGEGLDD